MDGHVLFVTRSFDLFGMEHWNTDPYYHCSLPNIMHLVICSFNFNLLIHIIVSRSEKSDPLKCGWRAGRSLRMQLETSEACLQEEEVWVLGALRL